VVALHRQDACATDSNCGWIDDRAGLGRSLLRPYRDEIFVAFWRNAG